MQRAQAIGRGAQDAFDLVLLGGLEFADAIAELDRGRGLDEQRGAGSRRVVDDAADCAARVPPYGDHEPTIPHRHRGIEHALMLRQS